MFSERRLNCAERARRKREEPMLERDGKQEMRRGGTEKGGRESWRQQDEDCWSCVEQS